MHVGERFLQCRAMSRQLHHIRSALGPPLGGIPRDLRTRSDNRELAETEILHRTRGRADVAGFVRLDEDDPDSHAVAG